MLTQRADDHSDVNLATLPNERRKEARVALVKALVLVGLLCWVFRVECIKIVAQASTMVQSSYVLVVPALMAMLLFGRREAIVKELGPGSGWGAVMLLLALAVYALASWPFYIDYVRKLQLVPACAGIVLAVAGWRVLWRCLPILLLMAVAIPIGWYTFTALINLPELLTLKAAAVILDRLPETLVELRGRDLHYVRAGVEGVIGLGDMNRGFASPVSVVVVCLFVIYARIRPVWQVIVLLAVVAPVVLLSNLLRVVLHGTATIYSGADPLDGMPRNIAMAASLALTYAVMAGCAWVLARLFLDTQHEEGAAEALEDSAA